MKKRITFLFLSFGLLHSLIAQNIEQNIRGRITDKESKFYLVGATVSIYKDSLLINNTSTDTAGN